MLRKGRTWKRLGEARAGKLVRENDQAELVPPMIGWCLKVPKVEVNAVFWSDLLAFLLSFLSHWQSYATGGAVTGLIGVIERLSGKQLSKQVYSMIFVVSFSLAAFFMAWRDEHRRANALDRANIEMTTKHEALRQRLEESKNQNTQESIFAISIDNQYASISNTVQAFETLTPQNSKTCWVRITAPRENRRIVEVLSHLASTFCRVDTPYDPTQPDDEILRGALKDAILVHMKKTIPDRGSFITALGNVFSVRRTYDLPSKSPADLVWIQIGPGNPWRKDPTKPGTEQ